MYYVYVLKSRDHWRFYVGMSQDVERRLKEHNSGKTKSTKGYRPWTLFFQEVHETRTAARAREKYLKSGYGKKWIKEKWSRTCLPDWQAKAVKQAGLNWIPVFL